MLRRGFLKAIPAVAMLPAVQSAPRLKIVDIRVVALKTIRETGTMEAAWNPGTRGTYRIGGGSITEIRTDQGLTGIGPGMDAASAAAGKSQLMGKDPFDIEQFAGPLRYYLGANSRAVSSLEIALWDLAGKAAQQPLYKLWGADKERVPAYASMIQLSTPEERVRMALEVKAQGWKAIKLRLHYQTMKEDIGLVEAVRKAVGEDMGIMTDANQAQSAGTWQPGVQWDFRRAVETARELQRLGALWLEEPLCRYDFDGLAELNRLVDIPIAGGENNHGVHEYRWMLERGVFDILQPDVMVADGVTGFRQIAELASAFNKRIIPHHGGGNLGTVAQLHAIACWPHAPWIELLHDPPIAAYTNGFAIMEDPPLVDKEGYLNLPQGPGLGVTIKQGSDRVSALHPAGCCEYVGVIKPGGSLWPDGFWARRQAHTPVLRTSVGGWQIVHARRNRKGGRWAVAERLLDRGRVELPAPADIGYSGLCGGDEAQTGSTLPSDFQRFIPAENRRSALGPEPARGAGLSEGQPDRQNHDRTVWREAERRIRLASQDASHQLRPQAGRPIRCRVPAGQEPYYVRGDVRPIGEHAADVAPGDCPPHREFGAGHK